MPEQSRSRRVALGIAAGLVSIAGLAAGAMAGLTVMAARSFVTVPSRRKDDIPILRADLQRRIIVLGSTPDSRLPGHYGLWFEQDSGYAKLGDIVAVSDRTVTRVLLGADGGDIETARHGRISGWFYREAGELGRPYQDVEVDTPVGLAPAWHFPAAVNSHGVPKRNHRWAILVHGRGVTRAEALRAVRPLVDEGWDSLLISYRNDGVAPPSADGRSALGYREWLDVEAAIRLAVEHGADDLVLMGWSLGGATVLQTATRAKLEDRVRGIILDSPVIDWVETLDSLGAQERLPPPVRQGAFQIVGGRWGRVFTGLHEPIELEEMDFVARAPELELPILLMHSIDDGYVVSDASRRLAQARPDIVQFEEYTIARHAKLWNYDPQRWETSIRLWLRRLDHTRRKRRRA